jgi:ankyrin repeat protein
MKTSTQTPLAGFNFPRLKPSEPELIIFLLLLTRAAASAVSIHEAAKSGDAVAAHSILQINAAAVSLTNALGEVPLHLAAGAASPEIVEALLAAKAPVNAQAQGNTALHYAILYRRFARLAEDLCKTNFQQFLDLGLKMIECFLFPFCLSLCFGKLDPSFVYPLVEPGRKRPPIKTNIVMV